MNNYSNQRDKQHLSKCILSTFDESQDVNCAVCVLSRSRLCIASASCVLHGACLEWRRLFAACSRLFLPRLCVVLSSCSLLGACSGFGLFNKFSSFGVSDP
mmetsp:Transcript_28407/g.44324  ORF Transcript_28407/g.44324 Transcript_28407/m.44324 type:complete len:101 (-) Transcript_28407:1583-1885(-)